MSDLNSQIKDQALKWHERADRLIAAAPLVIKTQGARGTTMREYFTPESYRALCEIVGSEIEHLEAEMERLRLAVVEAEEVAEDSKQSQSMSDSLSR